MIRIDRISNVNPADFDICYAIVRSMKNPSKNFQQLAALSPSWTLFKGYRNLVEAHQWNQGSFDRYYVPTFLQEMKSPEARAELNRLYWASERDNQKIALVCFCTQESLCHRSIIGGMLQGAGAYVEFENGCMRDYRSYYEAYRAM